MYTIITLLAFIIIFYKKLSRSPITVVFILALAIKVVVPYYYYNMHSLVLLFPDVLSAISIFLILQFSLIKESNGSVLVNNIHYIKAGKKYIYGIILIAPLMWFLFWFPAIYEGKGLPLFSAITENHIVAHDLRVFLTKESAFGVMVDIIGKVFFSILFLTLGFFISKQNLIVKIYSFSIIFLTLIVSFSYFQKAFPFNLLLVFIIGVALSGSMTKYKWLIVGFTCAILLLLISRLYGDSLDIALLKFQDLFFRRLGRVPILVYEAYIDYGQQYGSEYLKHNFIINKSPSNPALPMVIYNHMNYGSSPTGWANGYFVGDVFVNFGTAGVVLISTFIGYIIKQGNLLIVRRRINISFIVALMSIVSFSIIIPGNAFFAFSVQFFLVVFIASNLINKHLYFCQGKFVIKTMRVKMKKTANSKHLILK
jgi:hypothetical protein